MKNGWLVRESQIWKQIMTNLFKRQAARPNQCFGVWGGPFLLILAINRNLSLLSLTKFQQWHFICLFLTVKISMPNMRLTKFQQRDIFTFGFLAWYRGTSKYFIPTR